MLTSAHNRKKAEYFWPSVKWFPLKTVFFTFSVKYSLCITHHRTLRRDTCIFSTKHFTAKRTACCWHNQLSSGKVPMPGGRIISFPSRSRQTSVRQPFLRRILLKRKHPVRNCPTALAYQPRSLMLKAKSFVPFMWPAMPVVNSTIGTRSGQALSGIGVSAQQLFVLDWISAFAFVLWSDTHGCRILARNSQFSSSNVKVTRKKHY